MSQVLTEEQEQAARQFIEIVNKLRKHRYSAPLSRRSAIKFLTARKYDVQRAVSLYEQHELTRHREGLVNFDPDSEPLRSELRTGKFTILPGRDASGAAVAIFRAHMHHPSLSSHQTTLQGVVYQLDVALECAETQKNGLVFIYDMSNSKYSNFDYELSSKILNLLKGGYPAKLKKVLIVTAPLWFKAPFKILRLFVREKLRDRVFTVSISQLPSHIPLESLPTTLGGNLVIDHYAWLDHCRLINRMSDPKHPKETPSTSGLGSQGDDSKSPKDDDKQIPTVLEPSDVPSTSSSVQKKKKPSPTPLKHPKLTLYANPLPEDVCEELSKQLKPHQARSLSHSDRPSSFSFPSAFLSSLSEGEFLHGETTGTCLTMEQLIDHVRQLGRNGLMAEYTNIPDVPEGSFVASRTRSNAFKNRYTDIVCLDHSRVILSILDNDPDSDYINANYVDGYKQEKAYICTQGPLPNTSDDFWRMVWEQGCLVVVMNTDVSERGRPKCHQYWEPEIGHVVYDNFDVHTREIEKFSDFTITRLELVNLRTSKSRIVYHFHYTSWPDYNVPRTAVGMLDFLDKVRQRQAIMVKDLGDKWTGHPLGPPIVVHCSAGIGRTGTFCTIDISISRLREVGRVDIKGTVERVRAQRAHSIQMPEQYMFCYLALIEYALSKQLIAAVDLSELEITEGDTE